MEHDGSLLYLQKFATYPNPEQSLIDIIHCWRRIMSKITVNAVTDKKGQYFRISWCQSLRNVIYITVKMFLEYISKELPFWV
jgi:hypothetical protein